MASSLIWVQVIVNVSENPKALLDFVLTDNLASMHEHIGLFNWIVGNGIVLDCRAVQFHQNLNLNYAHAQLLRFLNVRS